MPWEAGPSHLISGVLGVGAVRQWFVWEHLVPELCCVLRHGFCTDV